MEKNSYAIDSTTTGITSQHLVAREDHNTQNDEMISSLEQKKSDVLSESMVTISDSTDSYATIPDDDPKNWPTTKKWRILFVVIVSGMLSPVASTILYPALITLQQELQTSETVVNSL
ncbi:20137_t:CDS:2, partial [Gigaspora rosea]